MFITFSYLIIKVFYSQALVLSNTSRKSANSGEIVNLMSLDSQRVANVIHWLNLLWIGESIYSDFFHVNYLSELINHTSCFYMTYF